MSATVPQPSPQNSKPAPQVVQATAQKAAPQAAAGAVDKTLVRIIQVTEAALSARTVSAAAAIMVNRAAEILPVDRVVLLDLRGGTKIETVSGGGTIAQDSSFGYAGRKLAKRFRDKLEPLIVPDEARHRTPSQHVREVQLQMNGTQIVWLPLVGKEGTRATYALWLERWGGDDRWRPEDLELLKHLSVFFGSALAKRRHRPSKRRKRIIWSVILISALVSMFIPVRNSITAPVHIEPQSPHYVFAPIEGVVKELLVKPGQAVSSGDVLYTYDDRVMEKALAEARSQVAVAKAELERLEGAAYRDADARAQLPVQRLEVKKSKSDVRFYTDQLARAEVKSLADGVVVLDDPDALIGAALQIGEVVMRVADPEKTKLFIYVPASDIGLVEEGAEVDVRLDRAPLKSIPGKVEEIGFDVVPSEDEVPSVLVKGIWKKANVGATPGQRGSAKIFGPVRPLGLQIFRKPLITMREITGL